MIDRNIRTLIFLALTAILLSIPLGVATAQSDINSSGGTTFVQLIISCVCMSIVLVFWGGVAFWIYNDANSRGANGMMWVIIIGGLGFIGMCGTLLVPLLGLCCNIPGFIGIGGYFFTRPNYMSAQPYPPTGPSWQ